MMLLGVGRECDECRGESRERGKGRKIRRRGGAGEKARGVASVGGTGWHEGCDRMTCVCEQQEYEEVGLKSLEKRGRGGWV